MGAKAVNRSSENKNNMKTDNEVIAEFAIKQIASIILDKEWGKDFHKAREKWSDIAQAITQKKDIVKPMVKFIKWYHKNKHG